MSDNKCNGWTNYETWRVNLDIFDGWVTDGQKVCADNLKDIAEEYINFNAQSPIGGTNHDDTIVAGWASAFLSNVNWFEIAEHINEENEINS